MATKISASIVATARQPYILTHKQTGERYAYSESHLARTRQMYARYYRRMRLEDFYTIVREYAGD